MSTRILFWGKRTMSRIEEASTAAGEWILCWCDKKFFLLTVLLVGGHWHPGTGLPKTHHSDILTLEGVRKKGPSRGRTSHLMLGLYMDSATETWHLDVVAVAGVGGGGLGCMENMNEEWWKHCFSSMKEMAYVTHHNRIPIPQKVGTLCEMLIKTECNDLQIS